MNLKKNIMKNSQKELEKLVNRLIKREETLEAKRKRITIEDTLAIDELSNLLLRELPVYKKYDCKVLIDVSGVTIRVPYKAKSKIRNADVKIYFNGGQIFDICAGLIMTDLLQCPQKFRGNEVACELTKAYNSNRMFIDTIEKTFRSLGELKSDIHSLVESIRNIKANIAQVETCIEGTKFLMEKITEVNSLGEIDGVIIERYLEAQKIPFLKNIIAVQFNCNEMKKSDIIDYILDNLYIKITFKIGDNATITKNPLDEQLFENIQGKKVEITDVKDTSHMLETSGQWVKTNIHNDWIDSSYFKIDEATK